MTQLGGTIEQSHQKRGLSSVRQLVSSDFEAVNQLITDHLVSKIPLINEVAQYIINSGGKRLRPLLVLLAAKALNYTGQQHIEIAAVIEFIHTATLLHDDVVDASKLRRGRDTANAVWGNQASVLVGDFLYSRSFQILTNFQNFRILDVLAQATNTLAEGEVFQLMNCNNPDATEADYLQVIRCKTAKLFEAAALLGAMVNQASAAQEKAFAQYGLHLGMAFQLVDDALDYSADVKELGKNLGDDLAEGKPTLPLIYAMRYSTANQVAIIRKAIIDGGLENLSAILEIIEETKALNYVHQLAQQQAQIAIHALDNLVPVTPYRQGLIDLAYFAIERNS